jgi:hypothetical protein
MIKIESKFKVIQLLKIKRVFESVVVVAFQSTFCSEKYQNNIFIFIFYFLFFIFKKLKKHKKLI